MRFKAAVTRQEVINTWVAQGGRYRETYCRRCGEELNSFDDEVCNRCGGIVCPYCDECFCR